MKWRIWWHHTWCKSQRGFKEGMKRTVCLFLFALLFFPWQLATTLYANHQVAIKILATSDMHNTFYPYDYARDTPYEAGSLARVAAVVEAERTEQTILIDNGDTLQGISSVLNMEDEVTPMITGMNALGYDVWSSGNHEFNYGVPFLEQAVASFKGQFLLANVYDANNERLRGAKNYTIVERSGVKVAIIGVVTPNITRWDRTNLADYRVTDPKIEVAAAVDEIQAGSLADLTVVSFHASVGGEYEGLTDAAEEIAREVPHIDAVIAGHEHTVVEKKVEGKTNLVPIVEPGRFGDYVSEVTLNVTLDNGKYRVVDYDQDVNYRNIKTADYPSDEQMLTLLEPFHARALADARTVIGELRDGPLVRASEIKGITQAQIEDTPLLDLILKVQLQTVERKGIVPSGARHVSGAALFSDGANLEPGPITKAGASRIYRYDNGLMTVQTTGVGLKQYMEWSANYYNTFVPGDLTISFNEDVRMYNYDMFSGVRYTINIAAPVGNRIEALTYNDGKEVRDDDEVYITVNSYRANTHLMHNLLPEGARIVYDSEGEADGNVRSEIVAYINAMHSIYPEVDNNWQLSGYAWDSDLRDVAKELVNRGDLMIPRSQDARTPNIRSLRRSDIIAAANVIDLVSLNDFHGAIDETDKNVGGAKLGGLIKQKQGENPQTVVLGGGDLFQGSALSNLTKGEVVAALLKEYGMVYSSIGNHEFDWGAEMIPKLAQSGGFDFLAANIATIDASGAHNFELGQPYGILEVGGKKIGLIGLTTLSTPHQTLPENVKDFVFLDPIETARKWERHLRQEEGVDVVFALTHMGSEMVGETIVGEAAELAQAVPTLDGIFSAHSHRFVAGKVGNVPLVQAGANGRGLSNMSIIYTKDGQRLATIGTNEHLTPNIATLPVDAASQKIIDVYKEKVGPLLNEVLGTNFQDLPHDRNAAENVTVMGQATAKMMQEIMDTDVAIINGGAIRSGLRAGDITVGDMYTVFPFDNTLVEAEVTGAHLKQLIAHGINPASFSPGQFYGVNGWYALDNDGNPQLTSLRLLNGKKIEDDALYRVATLDFLIAGGDWYDFTSATNIRDTGVPVREQLSEHIKAKGGIRHTFAPSLFLGVDPNNKNDIEAPTDETTSEGIDKLPHTGAYVREFVASALLLVVLSGVYLRWRQQHLS
jgi:2',3'-cyclic-nucleotide 2'-phosphodiesterase (5'-nucleotidase family)